MYKLSDFLLDVSERCNNEDGTANPATVTLYANESLRRARRKFDFPSAEVITQMALYTGVQMYALPYTGYKDFVALRDNFRLGDQVFMRNVSEDSFWSMLQAGNTRSEKRNGETRGLLFNLLNPSTLSFVANNATGLSTDGTWVAGGDAANVRTDTLFYRSSLLGSTAFDINTSTGTATLTVSNMTPKDFSGVAFKLTGMLTAWLYLPSFTAFTNVSLKWGSSAANYYTNAVTTAIDNGAFTTGWNQLGFDWLTATTVGTPNNAAINYLQFTFTFPVSMANQVGLRVNEIVMRQRRLFNLHSTTDFLVIDGSTLLPKESFASSTDSNSYFNIDRSFIDFFLYETLEQIFTTHIDDKDARGYYMSKRQELEQDLTMRYPSKRQPMVEQYSDQSRIDSWLKRGRGY